MGQLRRDLRSMSADGTAWSVMVGTGESYLPAFVLAVSSSQLASGLVTSIPMLAGALLQAASPWMVRRLGSNRRWVVGCAVAQALIFVPLIAAAWMGRIPLLAVFALATGYWAFGMAGGPAWNLWVETLVPARLRPRFFARRSRLAQVGLLGGFVAGGLLLQAGAYHGQQVRPFAILFLVAMCSRLVSAVFLQRQSESPAAFSLLDLPERNGSPTPRAAGADRRMLLYMLGTYSAVWIAGPYFTPYMFAHLRLSYAGYVALVCAAYVSRIALLPALGHLCERWGASRVLWVSGLLMVPIPMLWLVSDHYAWLLLLQVGSGIVWGGFELAILLLFFEAIPRAQRLQVLTWYNVAYAVAVLLGSLVGGAVLIWMESAREAYAILFIVSTVARVLAICLLVPQDLPLVAARTLVTRTLSLRPAGEGLERPVLASLSVADVPLRRLDPAHRETGDSIAAVVAAESAVTPSRLGERSAVEEAAAEIGDSLPA